MYIVEYIKLQIRNSKSLFHNNLHWIIIVKLLYRSFFQISRRINFRTIFPHGTSAPAYKSNTSRIQNCRSIRKMYGQTSEYEKESMRERERKRDNIHINIFICGRDRRYWNRDRFQFYDGVECSARTGNNAIYTFAERSVSNAHVAVHFTRSASQSVVFALFIISLYCILLLLFLFYRLFLSFFLFLADFEFIAPKNIGFARCIINLFIMLRNFSPELVYV